MLRKRIVNAYLSSVISISLVLLLTGVAALLVLNAHGVTKYLKENMRIRRAIRWNAANGVIAYYLHAATPYGVLAEIEGEYAEELPTQICMHICAINPEYISRDAVPAERIQKEKEIALAQVPADKPDKMKEGIVNGKINKWFATSCLMEQPWVMDDKTTLAKVAPKAKVVRFARWLAGEDVAEENA